MSTISGSACSRSWRNQPAIASPPFFEGPEVRTRLEGAWAVLALFSVSALFNTVIGEELLFRGLLLPRMQGVFGECDWLANGILFGLYRLSQPWTILGSAILGALFFAFPTRRYQCAWFGIVAHSGQSVFFLVLILGLVLGLASNRPRDTDPSFLGGPGAPRSDRRARRARLVAGGSAV